MIGPITAGALIVLGLIGLITFHLGEDRVVNRSRKGRAGRYIQPLHRQPPKGLTARHSKM